MENKANVWTPKGHIPKDTCLVRQMSMKYLTSSDYRVHDNEGHVERDVTQSSVRDSHQNNNTQCHNYSCAYYGAERVPLMLVTDSNNGYVGPEQEVEDAV